MNPRLTATASECTTAGDVRGMWDGSLLYLLIGVSDSDITTDSGAATNKDGVEVYIDLWNDKFSKYEEDDGMMRISALTASLSGSGSQNAIYPAIYVSRLKAYASAARLDDQGVSTGYNIELAFYITARPSASNLRSMTRITPPKHASTAFIGTMERTKAPMIAASGVPSLYRATMEKLQCS
jgi:hypothetical protein